MPFESAEALAENPERLKELLLQCRDNRAELGEAQCNAVSDAQRIRFMGKGTPYTPHPESSRVLWRPFRLSQAAMA
ncbi:hypothetical protein VLF92_07825 [Pseudomonas chengduensis]|nr:hypothetical protein [Pseudomonas sp. B11D7D]